MAAARAWAHGTLVAAPQELQHHDDALSDALAWGASSEELAGLRQHLRLPGAGAVSVWHSNVAAVTAFCLVASQWRARLAVVSGRFVTVFDGLDYTAVRVALGAMHIRVTPDLWAAITVMERAAAAALNGEPA